MSLENLTKEESLKLTLIKHLVQCTPDTSEVVIKKAKEYYDFICNSNTKPE